MDNNVQNFLKKQYPQGKNPSYFEISGVSYIIPYSYTKEQDGFKTFKADFFDLMRREEEKYTKRGKNPQYISSVEGKKPKIIIPYSWQSKTFTYDMVCKYFLEKGLKKYNHATRLYMELSQKHPDETFSSRVSRQNLRALQLRDLKDEVQKTVADFKACVQKAEHILASAVQKTTNNPKWDVIKLRVKAKRYLISSLLIAGATIGGIVKFATHRENASETPKENIKLEIAKEQTAEFIEQLAENTEQKALSVAEHNLNVFNAAFNDMICVIPFVEDYRRACYNDGYGVPTIGFGTTIYLDKNGKKTGHVRYGDKTTPAKATEQVERYLKSVVKPLFQKQVHVKMDNKTATTTAMICYLLGETKFKKSGFFQALNEGKTGAELSKELTIYRMQKGVICRNYVAALICEGIISPSDLLDLPIASCYSLNREDALVHNEHNQLQKEANNLARFKTSKEDVQKNLEKMRKNRNKPLRDYLPPEILQKVRTKVTSNASASRTSTAFLTLMNEHSQS